MGDVYTSMRFVLVLTVVVRFMCQNASEFKRAMHVTEQVWSEIRHSDTMKNIHP